MTKEITEQSLMPEGKDPKLWMVRCRCALHLSHLHLYCTPLILPTGRGRRRPRCCS